MAALIWIDTFVVAMLVLLVSGVLRSHAEILRSLHAADHERPAVDAIPSLGSEPSLTSGSDIVGVSPDQRRVRVPAIDGEHPTLLAFLTSGCLTCHGFWHRLGAGAPLPRGARAVIVTKGPSEELVSKVKELSPREIAVVMSSEAWNAYGVPGAPYFVWLNAAGVVKGVGTGTSWESIENLLEDSLEETDELESARRDETEQLVAAGIVPGHPSLHDPLRMDEKEVS